jgi:hypothetical protein
VVSVKKIFSDGKDFVIAENRGHAEELWKITVGDVRHPEIDAPFQIVPADQLVEIVFEQWGNIPYAGKIQIPDDGLVEITNGEYHITAKAATWAKINGFGILCLGESEPEDWDSLV